jgi:predicted NBD/HSP70 family sugar kinase
VTLRVTRPGKSPACGRSALDEVVAAPAAGDPVALGALEDVARWLGRGLAGLVDVLDPQLIVLGLRGRAHPFVADGLRAELDRLALKVAGELTGVVPAELGVDAPLLAAAERTFEPLRASPKTWAPARVPQGGTA